MKFVRVLEGVVQEVIPASAATPSVEYWYGADFAAQCTDAPDEVQQGWTHDGEIFSAPVVFTPSIDEMRTTKLADLSTACEAAITAGVDVTTAYGVEHFTLDDHDQTNITNLSILVGSGAAGYPYHADGKACVMYSAADITAIVTAALQHITYHTTYHNYVKQWVNREEDTTVLQDIIYGNDLPEDLSTAMAALLAAVSGS